MLLKLFAKNISSAVVGIVNLWRTVVKKVQDTKCSLLNKDIIVQIMDVYLFSLIITLATYQLTNVIRFLMSVMYVTAFILIIMGLLILYRLSLYIVNKLFTPWQQFYICHLIERLFFVLTYFSYFVSLFVSVAYADDGSGKLAPTLYSRMWIWLSGRRYPTATPSSLSIP